MYHIGRGPDCAMLGYQLSRPSVYQSVCFLVTSNIRYTHNTFIKSQVMLTSLNRCSFAMPSMSIDRRVNRPTFILSNYIAKNPFLEKLSEILLAGQRNICFR